MSLIETLVALVLSSMIVLILGQNLSMITLDALHFRQSSQAENSALLALLFLQHQLQSSQVRECAPNDQPRFSISGQTLIIHTLEDTIYVNTPEQAAQFRLPQKWLRHPTDLLLMDDCVRTQPVSVRDLKSALKNSIVFPISISLIATKSYALNQKNQLTVQTTQNSDHDPLFDHITDFKLTALAHQGLKISITPEGAHETFSLSITPF